MELTKNTHGRSIENPHNPSSAGLMVEATRSTPNILFNPSTGVFIISGRSMPEDCRLFYQPVMDWVEEFSKTKNVQVTVEFDLDYFSSSSSVFLLYIMKIFNEMNKSDTSKVEMVWKYRSDDESLLEAGQEYAEIIGPVFIIKEYS